MTDTAMIDIAYIVGARPNFMKVAALIHEMRRRPRFSGILIHTGQHFSPEMSDSFFQDLGLPAPDCNLGVHCGSHTQQTAEMMRRLEPVLAERHPDLVMVVGDVNSTVAAALVAARLGLRLAHVEAGLRSFDRAMPEEINRMVTDTLADYLFVSERSGIANLRAEGVADSRRFLVGNVMIDTLLRFRERASQSRVLSTLGLERRGYAVVTLHRPSNVDDPARLSGMLEVLAALAAELPVVFPVHPRTRERMTAMGFEHPGVMATGPLGYLDFLQLLNEARLVLTDSGGIQEETTILGVPCLTLRENTERPATIEEGTNRLVGTAPGGILAAAMAALRSGARNGRVPALWDGRAAARIFDVLEGIFAREMPDRHPELAAC